MEVNRLRRSGLIFFVFLFLAELRDIEGFVDHLWDGLDLCAQLLLDAVQGEAIVVSDQVDGNTWKSK